MTYHYDPEELTHSTHPHTCSRNPERPPAQWVQDGWDSAPMEHFGRWTRTPRMVRIQPKWDAKMAETCQYSDRRTATTCKHCPRRET